MGIRWRLAVLGIQLLVLVGAAWVITGAPVTSETWFVSGLLAIVINPQLLEPFYVRPQDVIANTLFGLVLIGLADKSVVPAVWAIVAALLLAAGLLALLAVVLGAGREAGESVRFARAARILSQYMTSWVVYSSIFWLGLVQEFPLGTNEFAVGAGTWVILVILGHVNWQTVWAAGTGRPALGQVEALLGPSRLAMTATDIPPIGSDVVVSAGSNRASGIVVNRFRRATDVWGDIHVDDVAVAERIFNHGRVEVVVASPPAHTIPDRLCGGWLLR